MLSSQVNQSEAHVVEQGNHGLRYRAGARMNNWVQQKSQIRLLLVIFVALLCSLGIASISAEAVGNSYLCEDARIADEYCGKTKYAGYWGGALFATISASLILKLLFTKGDLNWQLWLRFNFGFAFFAGAAYAVMLVLNLQAVWSSYTELAKLANEKSDVKQTGPENLDPVDKRELKATLADNVFFMTCTVKICIAVVLLLLTSSMLLLWLVNAIKQRFCRQYGEPSTNDNTDEAMPLQPLQEPAPQSVPVIITVEPPPTSFDEQTTINNAACEQVVRTTAEAEQQTEQPPEEKPRPLVIAAALYELVRQSNFCKSLETAYGFQFESSAAFDSASPDALVTLKCKQVQMISPQEAEVDFEEPQVLDTLQRFIERCVQPGVRSVVVRVPTALRDHVNSPLSPIRSVFQTVFRARGVLFAPHALQTGAAQLTVEYFQENESDESAKTQRALEYALQRGVRNLVLDISDLSTLFEVRPKVTVYSLIGVDKPPCRIFVYDGEIWRVPVDFLVNSASADLDYHNATGLASKIHEAAGVQLAGELERLMRQRDGRKLDVAEVLCSDGYQLCAARILHVRAPKGDADEFAKTEQFRLRLQELHGAVFNAACADVPPDANGLRIALPLVASGAFRGRHSLKDCFDPLLDVLTNGAGGSLQRFSEVHVVDYESDKIEKLRNRINKEFKSRFVREPDTIVRLTRPGMRPFACDV